MSVGTLPPIKHPPVVHVVRGLDRSLPLLSGGRPIVVISDWQFEVATQQTYWMQAIELVRDALGASFERALVLVAGDMASAGNDLRGAESDAAPELTWLTESLPPTVEVLMIYGNHDFASAQHLRMRNAASGQPCLLPHGGVVSTGAEQEPQPQPQGQATGEVPAAGVLPELPRSSVAAEAEPSSRPPPSPAALLDAVFDPTERGTWSKQERTAVYATMQWPKRVRPSKKQRQEEHFHRSHPEQAPLVEAMREMHLRSRRPLHPRTRGVLNVGAVHGIPASHGEGLKKLSRPDYWQAVEAVCSEPALDVLVTHLNPCLPGQEAQVRGDDATRLTAEFMRSAAQLHVHGHMHTQPVVSVLAAGKVVVNSDCRVVVLVPPGVE